MGRQLASFGDISYTYNEDGIRTSKTSNGITTKFYLDGTNIIEQTDGTTTLYFFYDSVGEIVGFKYNGNNYLYIKNSMGDIVGIAESAGNLITSYTYDAWGKVTSVTGSNTSIGELNPFRYRGYYYDSDIQLYYLQSRYYDPEIGRFINYDDVNYIGILGTVRSYNAFAYCRNNPIKYEDSSGYWLETAVDVLSIGWSVYDLVRAPSWINLGYLVWDIASAFIPFAPGSYTVKGGKIALKVANKASDFKNVKTLTTGTYKGLKKLFKGIKGVEVHHIIEKRFKDLFKKCASTDMFMSVPLTKELHKTITQRWRQEFKYGYKYKNITYTQMKKAIENVYRDMPELKKIALNWFEKNWKK